MSEARLWVVVWIMHYVAGILVIVTKNIASWDGGANRTDVRWGLPGIQRTVYSVIISASRL